jgi:hypothetical protein
MHAKHPHEDLAQLIPSVKSNLINQPMIVTNTEKISLLVKLQCLHGQYGNALAHAMSIGKCTEKELCLNTRVHYVLNTLRRYVTFENVVTNAGKIIITRLVEETSVTVEIFVNSILIGSYTGTGGISTILNSLQNIINNSTNIHGYYSLVENNILYLYSYDGGETYNDLIIGAFEENDDITTPSLSIASSSLENKLSEILDSWNCMSASDLCCRVEFLKKNLIR